MCPPRPCRNLVVKVQREQFYCLKLAFLSESISNRFWKMFTSASMRWVGCETNESNRGLCEMSETKFQFNSSVSDSKFS